MRAWTLVACLLAVACVPNEPRDKHEQEQRSAARPSAHRDKKRSPPRLGATRTPAPPSASAGRRTPRPAPPDPLVTAPFFDDFERSAPGADWTLTSGAWRIENGQLCAQRARNHPAWLKRRLPTNARIEFDATSSSPDGDLKAEVWGDGRGQAQGVTYDHATSYLTIFGGWKNQFHVLARINEHGKDRQEIRVDRESPDPKQMPVSPGQTYHFKIERTDGKTVRWYVDDLQLLTYADPQPLTGTGHDHFGFNDWDVRVCFDNLTVTPL